MRIAHISDLHFSHFTLNPLQFFSKRWLGNANLFFFRKRIYQEKPLLALPQLFQTLKVDLIIVAGDLSTTSLEQEFEKGRELFRNIPIKTLFVPGNHDSYTKASYQDKLFYRYFSNQREGNRTTLKKDGIEIGSLFSTWSYICLDTSLATSLFSSGGLFSPLIEKRLEEALSIIPQDHSILVINHFPLLPGYKKRKKMERAESLQKLLSKDQRVKFYLQGHTHNQMILDLREDYLPIILDSGSCGHSSKGSFHLIDLTEDSALISCYRWMDGARWEVGERVSFTDLNSTKAVETNALHRR